MNYGDHNFIEIYSTN